MSADGVTVTAPTRTWAPQQQWIFDWFADPGLRTVNTGTGALGVPRHLIIRARAGTGKTTTIIEAVHHAPERQILLGAFNKRIQEELASRLQSEATEAKTLHGVGLACVRRYWERVAIDEDRRRRSASLAEAVCGATVADPIKRLVARLATSGREMAPHAKEPGDLLDIALEFECVPDDEWAAEGFDLAYVEARALEAMELAAVAKPADGIDFADMLYLPVRNRWMPKQYDAGVVDEAQDMTAAQLELFMGVCRGRIVVVGDDCQAIYAFRGADSGSLDRLKAQLGATELGLTTTYRCLTPETPVWMGDFSYKPIGDIKAGETVIGWADKIKRKKHRIKYLVKTLVTATSQIANEQTITLHLKSGISVRSTVDHQWLAPRPMTGTSDYRFKRADRFVLGDKIVRVDTSDPGDCPSELRETAAWVGGIYDGEGHLYGISQSEATAGDLAIEIEKALRRLRFDVHVGLENKPRPGRKGRKVFIRWRGGRQEALRFLRWVPSFRYRAQYADRLLLWAHFGLMDEVVAIRKNAAPQRVCCITTETGNYVAASLCSHNCGRAIVELAQRLVPDFEAGPDNPEGHIDALPSIDALVLAAQPARPYTDRATGETREAGDFILSRTNAPLAKVAMALLRQQKRVRVQGRDIGAGLKALVKKLMTGKAAGSIPALLGRLARWEEREVERVLAADRPERVDGVRDKAETLRVLAEGVLGPRELEARLDTLFTDDRSAGAVTCSSVHRAKGLEAQRVFVLRDTLYPKIPQRKGAPAPPPEVVAARLREEKNIEYVAVTRAIDTLIWVSGR